MRVGNLNGWSVLILDAGIGMNYAGHAAEVGVPNPEQLSAIVTPVPGDVIFTGTPAGVGVARKPQRFLKPGEVLVSTIKGIGSITTNFVGA